jgi:hypothetical protein
MLKTIAALCLSATLGLTSLTATARPAHANEDLLGQLFFGAITAGIAYRLLRDDDDKRPAAAPPAQVNRGVNQRSRAYQNARPKAGPAWSARDKRRACRQTLPTRNGTVQFVSERCLSHPRANARVPQDCQRDRRDNGRWQQVYNRKCLARYGEVR